MQTIKNFSVSITFFFLFTNMGFSQNEELKHSYKWTIVAGLSQPIFLDGFNLAVNYTTDRWIFEYSHGIGLNYKGEVLREGYRENLLSLSSPYSTGPGIGYRFFSNDIYGLDLRAEAKVHQYDVQLNSSDMISYTNFDLGGGTYLQIRPFGRKENALQGIVIEPSLRYWAQVSSTLKDGFSYITDDGRTVSHEPYPLNLFINISIGYTFAR